MGLADQAPAFSTCQPGVKLSGSCPVCVLLGHFRPAAAPGEVRGVPTSLPVSLPTRQLTLGGVISAVAHMDFCFERCHYSRSPHWTGLTLRPCRERYKTRSLTESTSSKGGHTPRPAHATSSIDHQDLPSPIPQIRLPTTFTPQLCLVSCCPPHYGKRLHVRTTKSEKRQNRVEGHTMVGLVPDQCLRKNSSHVRPVRFPLISTQTSPCCPDRESSLTLGHSGS